jgi:hypothetical protein
MDDQAKSVSVAPIPFQARHALSPFAFTAFTPPTFARLLIALLEFKAPKKAIILDLLFKDFHGLLKVIINDLDLQAGKVSQVISPLSLHHGIWKAFKNPHAQNSISFYQTL